MSFLEKIHFRHKINLSFAGLIILVAINALAGIYTVNFISEQMAAQSEITRVIERIIHLGDSTEQFRHTGSRKAVSETFSTLELLRHEIEQNRQSDENLRRLTPLVDDFRILFQKYVIETDQKAALESRAIQVGKNMADALAHLRESPRAVDRNTADAIVFKLFRLQWQGVELKTQTGDSLAQQLAELRLELGKLRAPPQGPAPDVDAQRLQYRLLQTAADYLNSLDGLLRYQELNRKTSQDLARISEQLQTETGRFSALTRETIQEQIPKSIVFMLVVFVLTLIGSALLAPQLSHAILKPILGLLDATQAVSAGNLEARAQVAVQDEIGELAASFNTMADNLNTLKDNLEFRVEERTRQLVSANQILEQEIAVRQRAEVMIAAREQLLRTIIDLVPQFIYARDYDGKFTIANQAMANFYGTTPAELVGKSARDFHPQSNELSRFSEEDRQVILSQHTLHIPEEAIADIHGVTHHLETTKIPLWRDIDSTRPDMLGISIDITERKRHQQILERIAHYDTLTDLPNRVMLADRMRQAMSQALRRGNLLAVVYLDLDGFKPVNDTYGHPVGDRLLAQLATRLKQALREGDTLARMGGDEFVAVLLDIETLTDSLPILERLLAAAKNPVHTDGLNLQVSASLGVTFYPQQEEIEADQLLRQADQAMYQAKQAGKNRYHLFDAERDRSVRGFHENLERLRRALANDEFVLHYQPKVNMRSGTVIGVEALIRWQHPERGLLPPAEFMPLIENQRLSIDIGDWVLQTALAQIEDWRRADINLPVSINIDASYFSQNGFVDQLRHALARHPLVQHGDLELEVLETSALEDIAHLSDIMTACRMIGVDFALDDFGTGYSSLTYLKRLPARLLKVDQSFVRDMLDDPEDLAILEGVVGLAQAFRRQVIAEGVETLAHGELLLQMGCEYGQGYAIARPMPAHDIASWLARWHPSPAWGRSQRARSEDMPLLFAMVEHRAWLSGLRESLHDKTPLWLTDFSSCRLTQWLGEQRVTDLHDPLDITCLRATHEHFHHLLSAFPSENNADVPRYLSELEAAHKDLLLLLQKLLTPLGTRPIS